jgi:hypothetical protein
VIDDAGKDGVDGIATGPCGRQGLDITRSLEVRGGLNPEQISYRVRTLCCLRDRL